MISLLEPTIYHLDTGAINGGVDGGDWVNPFFLSCLCRLAVDFPEMIRENEGSIVVDDSNPSQTTINVGGHLTFLVERDKDTGESIRSGIQFLTSRFQKYGQWFNLHVTLWHDMNTFELTLEFEALSGDEVNTFTFPLSGEESTPVNSMLDTLGDFGKSDMSTAQELVRWAYEVE